MAKKSFLLSGRRILLSNKRLFCNGFLLSEVNSLRQCSHLSRYTTFRVPAVTFHRNIHTSTLADEEVRVGYVNGLPQFCVKLPSRSQQCLFTMRPFTNTVSDLMDAIKSEDLGVDRVALFNSDGVQIAKTTPIDILLREKFELVINDQRFAAHPPTSEVSASEHTPVLEDVKRQISQLYGSLNIEQFQIERERFLLSRLETLRAEIAPYEKAIDEIDRKANVRLRRLAWGGLAFMGLQFGFLARLTWWEYSWDIMEPVTYFINLAYATLFFGYYVVTQQECNFRDAYNREYLLSLHRHIDKRQLNLQEYNRLKVEIADCETDLRRLRDPLQAHLPISQLPPVPFKHHTMDAE